MEAMVEVKVSNSLLGHKQKMNDRLIAISEEFKSTNNDTKKDFEDASR